MIRHIRNVARWLWRSAITGRFVDRDYAQTHPDTTIKEKKK